MDQLHDARDLAGLRVAAIGPGTASALLRFGIRADLVPERNVAEGLADVFPEGKGRVFLPQAEAARPVLAEALRAKGWAVDAVVAYRTRPAALDESTRAAAATADAITFTSSSTVANFIEAAGIEAVPATIISIGPITSAAVLDRGLVVSAEASPHTIDGVVAAVLASLEVPGTSRPPAAVEET